MDAERKKALRDLAVLDALSLVQREAQIRATIRHLETLCHEDKDGFYNEFIIALRKAEESLPHHAYKFVETVLQIREEDYEYTNWNDKDRLLAEFYGIEDRHDENTDWAAGCDRRQEQHPVDLIKAIDSEKE
jgi:hypothetical protein